MAEDDPYPKKNIIVNPVGNTRDIQGKPWLKYQSDAPQSAAPSAAPTAAPEQMMPGKPWEKYKGVADVQAAAPSAIAGEPWKKYQTSQAPQDDEFKPIKDPEPSGFQKVARAFAYPFKKIGEHLGVPEEEIKNKEGKTVFPTNALERGLQASSSPTWELFTGTGYAMKGGPLPGKSAKIPHLLSLELQKRFSPTTVSPKAGEAEASIRKAGGQAARSTATAADMMEPYHQAVNAAPREDQLNFIETIEGGSSQNWGYSSPVWRGPHRDALLPLAEKLRVIYQARRSQLESMTATQKAEFIDRYFAHMWKDPQRAASTARMAAEDVGAKQSPTHSKMVGIREKPIYQTRQGSGASLRKRTIPTIREGIEAGLEPISTDPIEITMRYVQSMDAFIAQQKVFGEAVANGTIKYIKPKTTGASGHPDAFKIPEGYVALKGRGATKLTGEHAYAPEDWARVYNNYIDAGIHASEAWGNVYDAALHTSSAVTALELGLSAFHVTTMAFEGIISDFAKGVSQLAGGEISKGLRSIAKSPIAPITRYSEGKKGQDVYLGRTQGSPDLRELVDVFTEAGGRAVGKTHAPDYRFSRMGSYFTAWKRGALKMEMADAKANLKSIGAPIEVFKQVGRFMDTVAQPIFETYIPRLKKGAALDLMRAWVEANPGATHEQKVATMRRIVDSVDNRFGEMIQDNIFWNKGLKQGATFGMRAYSWFMGTVREIGGGVLSAMHDPSRISIKSTEYDPRAAYIIAMPIVISTINAIYEGLKTGTLPEGPKDLAFPRTGGTTPGFGGRGKVPERGMLPGYHRDVFGWYNDWQQEVANKLSKAPSTAWQAIRPGGPQDYSGHPAINPEARGIARLGEYFKWVIGEITPISVKTLLQGEKKGSNISTIESMLGIRPAPMWAEDPEGTKRGKRMIEHRAQRSKDKAELRKKRQYGGPQQ